MPDLPPALFRLPRLLARTHGATKIRSFVRLMFAIGLTVLALGCGRPQDPEIVIDFWAMGREGELVRELITDFEREHPGIRVRVQQVPWSAAHEKLLTAYVGNTMPDVFQLGNTWIPEFVTLRAVLSLDDFLDASESIVAEDYFPGVMRTNVIDDRVYGLPWYVDTRVLFYRKDLLKDAGYSEMPKDWGEWRQAMRAVKAREGKDHYPLLLPVNDWVAPVIFALQMGAPLLRDQDQFGDFENDRFKQAFDFYLDWFNEGLAQRVGSSQVSNLYHGFARGAYTALITGPWNLGEFRRRLPPEIQDRWTTAALPGPDGDYPGFSLAGGASLVISSTTDHPETAWQLIEYINTPQRQLQFYRLSGDLPASKMAWRLGTLTDERYIKAFWIQLQRLASPPRIPEWERIAAKITQYSEATIRNEQTPNESLRHLNADTDKILEKRRWLLAKEGRQR